MSRFKKVPEAEMKNTSMRKVRSTCESIEEHTSPSLFQRPRDGYEYQPSPWSCLISWLLLPISVTSGLPVTTSRSGS